MELIELFDDTTIIPSHLLKNILQQADPNEYKKLMTINENNTNNVNKHC